MPYELLTSLGRQAANHVWQSTLFAAAAGVLVLALKANHARVRYWVWLAASLKFLMPFSLLRAIGSRLGSRYVPAAPAPLFSFVMDAIARPFAPLPHAVPAPAAAPAQPGTFPLAALLAAVWALGCAAVLLGLWRRWRRVRAIVRASEPAAWNRPQGRAAAKALRLGLVSSPAALEPGIFGIFRPVLYLPAGIANGLSDAELDAVLAHELCHARRRDNLTAAMHMIVEAMFWFHPLVWWLGARLIEERERACDEEVLRLGIEPQVYAQGILQVCTLCLKSPLACAAGVTGSHLKKRIADIMTQRVAARLSSGRKVLLAGAALLAAAGPVLTGVAGGPRLRAQTEAATFGKPSGPKFEVASIKPAPDLQTVMHGGPAPHVGIKIDAARVDIGHWSIKQLIMRAYGLQPYQVSGPDWMESLRFDVLAKLPEGATGDQLPGMLEWLLVERFGLAAHGETRELPALALVVGKGGPKMKPAAPDAGAPAEPSPVGRTLDGLMGASPDGPFGAGTIAMTSGGGLHIEVAKMPMDALATVLASWLREPVIDMTGLPGKYQVTLDFSLPGTPGGDAPGMASEPMGASMSSAVERLGLRLERRKAPIAVLVVDRVQRVPTEN
jgi:uncharacterized protein (TIGR03435 family)